MDEVFPILGGVVIALATHHVRSGPLQILLIVGGAATWIGGELAVSWVYVLIDTAQAVGAAVMTVILVRVWQQRARRMTRSS